MRKEHLYLAGFITLWGLIFTFLFYDANQKSKNRYEIFAECIKENIDKDGNTNFVQAEACIKIKTGRNFKITKQEETK